MKLLRSLIHVYSPSFVRSVVYMLQSTEYEVRPYLAWLWRSIDFAGVMHRRTLDKTGAARKLIMAMTSGMLLQYSVLMVVAIWAYQADSPAALMLIGVFALLTPLLWAHLIVLPLLAGRVLIVNPRQNRRVIESQKIFKEHPGIVIAVAGSYGKTTMKELLLTVLTEGKKVAATPGNKNVAISHARFAETLQGDEDVLVIEYGEGKPGDVIKFAQNTDPDMGIITGIAPAHLDKYPDLDAAARDIFALADYLGSRPVYVNGDSQESKNYIKKQYLAYSSERVGDWKISDIQISLEGTSFRMTSGKKQLRLSSKLLGRHQIGPLAVVAAIASDLGLTDKQIEAGIGKTQPYEHRMQPYQLGGAWIIDDTYNGNIEGLKSGLELLAELPAKRKIYVTPGLVDQGVETKNVHVALGEAIARSNPDEVVLMNNSVTKYIQEGMESFKYGGSVKVVDDPLGFYTNLAAFVAAGDLVLMQNDWTDNYA